MKRLLKFLATLGLGTVLVSGCYPYRLVEFSPLQPPPPYEKWKISVWIRATCTAKPPSKNRLFEVGASAWTIQGDVYHGKPSEFQASAYEATIQSLRLFWIEGTNTIEISLPEIGPSARHATSSNWVSVSREKVEIPTSVTELRAVLVMSFWNRATGQTEVKTIDLIMIKRKRIKIAPVMV